MKTTRGSPERYGSSLDCRRRNALMRQPKRIASCSPRSGIVSAPGNCTAPSKSRISVRDMGGLPCAIGLEPPLERLQECAQDRIADEHGVNGECESRTELSLDFGIVPAGDVIP